MVRRLAPGGVLTAVLLCAVFAMRGDAASLRSSATTPKPVTGAGRQTQNLCYQAVFIPLAHPNEATYEPIPPATGGTQTTYAGLACSRTGVFRLTPALGLGHSKP
jgi:hypothetical protein